MAVSGGHLEARGIVKEAHPEMIGGQVLAGESGLEAGAPVGARILDLAEVLDRVIGDVNKSRSKLLSTSVRWYRRRHGRTNAIHTWHVQLDGPEHHRSGGWEGLLRRSV